MIEDPCVVCGEESDVGCASGGYHYYMCDKHWAELKRGKHTVTNGEYIEDNRSGRPQKEIGDSTELLGA